MLDEISLLIGVVQAGDIVGAAELGGSVKDRAAKLGACGIIKVTNSLVMGCFLPTIRRLPDRAGTGQRDLLSLAAKKVGKETVGILAQRFSRPNHQIPKANAA